MSTVVTQYKRLTKLSELSIAKHKRSQSPQSFKGLVAVLCCRILVYGCSRKLGRSRRKLAGLPDKVLEQVALVLAQKENLGLLNDIASVSNQVSAFLGKLR